MYHNSKLRSNVLPQSVSTLKTYYRRANTEGDGRDIRPFHSLLKRLPAADRYFSGLLQTRRLAVTGCDYTLRYPLHYTPSSNEEKILFEMNSRFKKSKMKSLANTIVNGRLFGLGAIKLIWGNKEGLGTCVEKAKAYDLTDLDIDPDDDNGVRKVTDDGGTPAYSKFDDNTIAVRHNPLHGVDNTFMGGFAGLNWIFIWLKYWECWNWAKNNEKYGDPQFWAQYKSGTQSAEKKEIWENIQKLAANNMGMFSENVTLNVLETMRKASAEAHDKFISVVNKETAISILGQQLTTEVGEKGSYAAAKVANFVRQDILFADLAEAAWGYDDYLIQDFNLNYGDPKTVYPEFVYVNKQEDFEANSRILSELALAGVPVKKSEAYKKVGFTEPAEGDETIFDKPRTTTPTPTPEV